MINKQLINLSSPATGGGGGGNQEEGLILHLDANDVDSYDGDGTEWVDIANHEYTPSTDVSEHFNTVLWTGDDAADREITGVGFTPDLVWIKNRDTTDSHQLYDSLRGNYGLYSNGTDAQFSQTNWDIIDDGFDLGAANDGRNETGKKIVAWCFKAGGAPSGSDKVSIDGTSYADEAAAELTAGSAAVVNLSANTKLGFSVVETGTYGSSEKSHSHGLGVKPELIIVKSINDSSDWFVWAEGFTNSQKLTLNSNAAKATHISLWGASDTTPHNSNDFTFYGSNGQEYIAYCFASKRGVSKVGSYIGTSAAGNKVVTGFEPAFVMVKRTNSTGNWMIHDNKRSDNDGDGQDLVLYADLNNGEDEYGTAGHGLVFNRDGFTINATGSDTNVSGSSYIYYAVAKSTNETELTPNRDDFTAGSVETTGLEVDLDANSYSGSGDWLDGTLNNHDGTITGATYVNDSSADYFEFDGSGDSVTTSYSAPTGAKTIELWYNASTSYTATYPSALGGTNEILWVGGNITANLPDESIYWYQQPSILGLVIREGVNKYLDDQWHHLVIVDTGSDHKMYVDGEEKSIYYTYGSASVRMDWDNLVLGRGYRTNGTDDFKGKIGQVRLYSSALTSEQIKSNYEATRIYSAADLKLHLDAGDLTDSSTTWGDKIVSGNNGTLGNASYDAELGDSVNIPATSFSAGNTIEFSSNPVHNQTVYSIETWVKFPNNTSLNSGTYITLSNHGGRGHLSGRKPASGYTHGIIRDYIDQTEYASTSSLGAIKPEYWHHYVSTRNGTSLKQYLDGNLVGSHTVSSNAPNVDTMTLGAYKISSSTENGYFGGDIGQVRIYSTALSEAQIRQNFNYTKPNYPNGFNGTISGATWNSSGYFDFDGSGDSVNLGSDLRFDVNSSIALWINPETLGGNRAIISKWQGSSPYGWLLNQQNNGNLEFFFYSGSTFKLVNVGVVSTNSWSHIVITYDGNNLKAYLNNTLANTTSNIDSLTPNDNSTDVLLCSAAQAGITTQQYDGKISKVKMYDKALTQAEITALYDEGQ